MTLTRGVARDRIFIELMTSDRRPKARNEGSTGPKRLDDTWNSGPAGFSFFLMGTALGTGIDSFAFSSMGAGNEAALGPGKEAALGSNTGYWG